MATKIESNIEKRIAQLVESGYEPRKVAACLTLEDHLAKDINEAMKAAGLIGRKKAFRSCFHDWLVEADRTESDVEDYVNGKGEFGDTSDNVKKHLSVYKNEWKLACRVRDTLSK